MEYSMSTLEKICNMNIKELKNECRMRNLHVSGLKKDLILRILYSDNNLLFEQIINRGKEINANYFIKYGSTDILGYYKLDGHSYNRPLYCILDENGERDINKKIQIAYRSNLDECGNPHNCLHKGYWFIASNDFNWNYINIPDIEEYYYYNKTSNLNDDYEVPMEGWEDEIEIIKIQ